MRLIGGGEVDFAGSLNCLSNDGEGETFSLPFDGDFAPFATNVVVLAVSSHTYLQREEEITC